MRATLILYESGPRLGATLAALAKGLGERDAAVVREISKKFEETVTGTLSELAGRYAERASQGRDRHRRRAARRGGARYGRGHRRGASRCACATFPRRAPPREVAEALGLPRKRVYERAHGARNEAPASGARRPARRNAGRALAAAAGLDDPRPAGAHAGRRGRPDRAPRPDPGLHRGEMRGAARPKPPCRSTITGCGASRPPPRRWRRATCATGDDVRIDAIFVAPRQAAPPRAQRLARVTSDCRSP